jgi:hypothetical protein
MVGSDEKNHMTAGMFYLVTEQDRIEGRRALQQARDDLEKTQLQIDFELERLALDVRRQINQNHYDTELALFELGGGLF